VEDVEGRFDVRDQGWRFSSLKGCDEPGRVLVLRTGSEGVYLCSKHWLRSLPLCLIGTIGCTPEVNGMTANNDEVISLKSVELR